MLLSEIVERLVVIINDNKSLISTTDFTAIETLDYETCLQKEDLQVLVVPDNNSYTFDEKLGRRRILSHGVSKNISIMIGKSFVELAENDDVAPWSESKDIINTREKISQLIIKEGIEGMTLAAMEEIPPEELELGRRNYVAITQVSYEAQQCGSGPDLQSLLTVSEEGSGRASLRASIRQQVSSAKRQGIQ